MILTKAGQTFADDKADVEIQEEYGAPAAPVIDSYGGPQAAPISRLFIIIIITILINYHYNPYQLSLSIIIIILITYHYHDDQHKTEPAETAMAARPQLR